MWCDISSSTRLVTSLRISCTRSRFLAKIWPHFVKFGYSNLSNLWNVWKRVKLRQQWRQHLANIWLTYCQRFESRDSSDFRVWISANGYPRLEFSSFFWSSFSPRGASASTPLLATASVVFDFLWLMVVLSLLFFIANVAAPHKATPVQRAVCSGLHPQKASLLFSD